MQTNFLPPFELVHLADRLREQRDALDLTQAIFAAKLGVHRLTQINYEKGKLPPLDYLNAAAALGVDVVYVVTGVHSKPAKKK